MSAAPDSLGPPLEIEIRPMTESDVRSVIVIERASYQFPWSEGIFRDCLRVSYLCRVAASGGEIVGYGIMSTGAGEAHVLNLCVHAPFRNRGVGGRFLEHLIEHARRERVREIFLEVRPSNTAAIRLYHSLGFRQVGIRRGYYQAAGGREDAAVLKRVLIERGGR